MNVNEKLHQLKDSYMTSCHLPEDKAWYEAYTELANTGAIVDFFKYRFNEGKCTYMYLYATSSEDGKHYTYLSARHNGGSKVYLSEYFKLRKRIKYKLKKEAKFLQHYSTMLTGLNQVYTEIVFEYFKQFCSTAKAVVRSKYSLAMQEHEFNNLVCKFDSILKELNITDVKYHSEPKYDDLTRLDHVVRCLGESYTISF